MPTWGIKQQQFLTLKMLSEWLSESEINPALDEQEVSVWPHNKSMQ